ncbi:hypothetical protein DsansV1_C27g0197811 [Dioscorea sansibarensis]
MLFILYLTSRKVYDDIFDRIFLLVTKFMRTLLKRAAVYCAVIAHYFSPHIDLL